MRAALPLATTAATAIAPRAPTNASRLADQIAWADANGYTAMAALAVWTRIIALVWRAIDTDAGASAVEALHGVRPTRERPAQHIIVETDAIRVAASLELIDNAEAGALIRACTSVTNAIADNLAEDPVRTHLAGAVLRECAGAVRKLANA